MFFRKTPYCTIRGLFKPRVLAHVFDHFGSALWSQGGGHRVTRQDMHDEEDQRGQDEDHRQGQADAGEDIAPQARGPPDQDVDKQDQGRDANDARR